MQHHPVPIKEEYSSEEEDEDAAQQRRLLLRARAQALRKTEELELQHSNQVCGFNYTDWCPGVNCDNFR